MIAETDRAYIAGLFDGEGIFITQSVQKKRKNIMAKVTEHLCHNVLVWK